MANVNHNTLTDPYLHEPKGVSTATAGQVYIANGAGSGDWVQNHNYVNGYIQIFVLTVLSSFYKLSAYSYCK